MALDAIQRGLETAVMVGADSLAFIQTGVDKVLWGKNATVYSSEVQVTRGISRTNSKKAAEQIRKNLGSATPQNTALRGTTVEQTNQSRLQGPNTASLLKDIDSSGATTNAATSGTERKARSKSDKNKENQIKKNQQLLNPLDLGIFPILDTLTEVDLCNILQSLLSKVGGQVPTPRKEEPTALERALYNIQDIAAEVQKGIDTFTSYPDRLIGRYTGLGPIGATPQQAEDATGQAATQQQSAENYQQGTVPGATTSGTNTQKFNLVNLIAYIRTSLTSVLDTTTVDGKPILGPEDRTLLAEVPGLGNALTYVNDKLLELDKYSDYRNIDDETFQKLLTTVNQVRQYCVLIQGLSFKNPLGFIGLLPPGKVQEQANRIQQLFPVDKIMVVLKQINNALQSFITMVRKVQGLIQQGQFIVKIGVLLVKVFKIIVRFLQGLPIPNLMTVAGQTTVFASITNGLLSISDALIRVLGQINTLLGLIVSFIRYLEVNTQQLLRRMYILLSNLEACETLKDNPALEQLTTSTRSLLTLNTELQTFIDEYDAKIDPESATLGKYKIQVIDEETTDPSIVNKRRRGVALDANGVFVLQSDLTFATDLNIIIQEVKIKLISAGLVQPGLGQISGDIAIISNSLNFLADNDLLAEDLNLQETDLENPDSEDENAGLGLQAFINKLSGGKRLRRRVRQQLAQSQRNFAQTLQSSDPGGKYSGTIATRQANQANQLEIKNLQEQIGEWKKQITAAVAAGPANPASIALVRDRLKRIKDAQVRIKQLGG